MNKHSDIISDKDLGLLRGMVGRVAEINKDPRNEERKRLWKKEKALKGERPMILAEIEGVLSETVPETVLECEGDWARGMEKGLRNIFFYWDHVQDDKVFEPRLCYGHQIIDSGFGVQETKTYGSDGHGHGSYVWDPPLKDLPADLSKAHFRRLSYDKEGTLRTKQLLEDLFGDLVPIVNRGGYWWTLGMTWQAVMLIGLENLMLYMYDNPEGLHAVMSFLRDDHMQAIYWYESNGLLTLNNEDDYIGSGSIGYTDQLPAPGYVPGTPARCKDMWTLSESQETVSVSPEKFEEFVFPYQLPVASRFGLLYYGCCEPVDSRWHILKRFPNLRALSISPWSNEEKMVQNLGKDYVYSRKPNPAQVSAGWDEKAIREDLRKTVNLTKGMNVEIVMKDVHTLSNEPWRLGRWVEIAREVIDEVYG